MKLKLDVPAIAIAVLVGIVITAVVIYVPKIQSKELMYALAAIAGILIGGICNPREMAMNR
jgi:hypothetical protein